MTDIETDGKATRRRFLKIGGGAAVSALAAPLAQAANANGIDRLPLPASHPDADLVAMTEEHARLEAEWLTLLDPMEAAESLRDNEYRRLRERECEITDQQDALREHIVAIPARTPLGALRKLSVAPEFADYGDTVDHWQPYPWPELVASVMRDLEAMAEGAS